MLCLKVKENQKVVITAGKIRSILEHAETEISGNLTFCPSEVDKSRERKKLTFTGGFLSYLLTCTGPSAHQGCLASTG